MLSFLLLASTTGQPLPAAAAARCASLPTRALSFVPTASTTWRSDGGHVLLVAWADDSERWHVDGHGCTFVAGTPWPLDRALEAPGGVAFELTQRLGDPIDPGPLERLTGAATVVRVAPDGTGVVASPPTGGGAVHVARGDGLVAVADRAGLAATGIGGVARRHQLPTLVRGVLTAGRTAHTGIERLRPGAHLALRGRLGTKVVEHDQAWTRSVDADLRSLATSAADEVTHLVEQAVRRDGDRWLELGPDPGSLVLAAAVAATGTTGRLRVRPVTPDQADAARPLARQLGVELESPLTVTGGGEAVDRRLRRVVARTEAMVAPTAVQGGLLGLPRETAGTVLAAVPGGPLAPDPGPPAQHLVSSQAWTELDAAERAWRAGRGHAVAGDAARAVLAELDLRTPVRQAAAAALAGRASLLDPLGITSVARLALAAAAAGADATRLLVEALHPPLLEARVPGGEEPPAMPDGGWRTLAPVLEAHVLGHGRDLLGEVLDLDEVAAVVRSGSPPDPDTARALEGAAALAVWVAGRDLHHPVRTGRSADVTPVATPEQVPTLVTGVTSRSLLTLAGLSVPLDVTEADPLLGVEVDREVRDLVHRLLLAAGATPGHLPEDLEQRLSGTATAHLADPARALLARRGGTLADPRLALTLPFWRAHVVPPRVVLVAERPPDLAARTTAQLPLRDLLGWWVDAMTSAAASGADVRIVDPGDLAALDEAEATGWDGLESDGQDVPDLVRVVRTVDSLVREVELDAARPLLRTIRRARAVRDADATVAEGPAVAPLHVVDELWERAVAADRRALEHRRESVELETRVSDLESELAQLRSRSGLRAAWQVLTGR